MFLDFFQITYWLAKLSYITYLVVIYAMIFVICLVILDIFYVSYSFTKKKFAFVWPLKVLRSVCGLIVTTLFLPLLESFISIIHCSQHHDTTSSHLLRFLSSTATTDTTTNTTVAINTGYYMHMFPS